MKERVLPEFIRASLGSAIALKLTRGKIDTKPSTIYLLTYRPGKCMADCGFCSQAKSSTSKADLLSRVSWPVFRTEEVINALEASWREGSIKRVCIQALNYREVFDEVYAFIKEIYYRTKMPISLSCQPVDKNKMKLLAEAGLDRIGIPLDAANREVFNKVKGIEAGGPYLWEKHLESIEEATKIFGEGRVSTHIIIGLGEKDSDVMKIIDEMLGIGVCPALFAFTPIHGTRMEELSKPSLRRYRWIQLARYLMVEGKTGFKNMKFDRDGNITDLGAPLEIVREAVASGKPFMTTGCLNCDRPYYNEEPRGPLYNFPRRPNEDEITEIEKELLG